MEKTYDNQKLDFKEHYGKELSDRLKEAEEWMQSCNEGLNYDKRRDYNSLVGRLFSFIGYFSVIRDKLGDELVFSKDSLRSLNIQIKRLEKDFESRKSELKSQVELRNLVSKEYEVLEDKKNGVGKDFPDYVEVREQHYHIKKKKGSAEGDVRKNALACQNLTQAIELMKLASEQNKISLVQGEEILQRVEMAIEGMNMVYQKVVMFMQSKKVIQTTGGENDTKE